MLKYVFLRAQSPTDAAPTKGVALDMQAEERAKDAEVELASVRKLQAQSGGVCYLRHLVSCATSFQLLT